MNRELEPIRARALDIRARPEYVDQVIGDGAATARRVAGQTIREVKELMGLGD
jgi:tryptophanyl-tRNA synthetase